MLGETTSVASPAVAAPILILGRGRGSRRGRATSMVVTTLQRVAPSRTEPGREEYAPIFPSREWISKFFPTYFTPYSAYNGKTISRKWKRILLNVSRGTTTTVLTCAGLISEENSCVDLISLFELPNLSYRAPYPGDAMPRGGLNFKFQPTFIKKIFPLFILPLILVYCASKCFPVRNIVSFNETYISVRAPGAT